MTKKKGLILTLLAIISLISITAGVTYAFFNYVKEGTTENTITTGTITFLYTETSEVGRGIMLENAYPISDSQGKNLTGEGNVFDFKITSSNTLDATIPYEITARKKSDSSLPEEAVRIYLTKVNGTEEEVLLDNYSELDQTDKVASATHIEKTLYKGKVPANEDNYNQEYRLRMWVDEDVDFSPDENNNYQYNNKTFTITVNVYANAKVVTDEEIENASKAEISSLSVEGTELTKVENQDYDYETTLPEGTTSTTINVETISEYATVEVEKIDSLAYSSNIKRLAATKAVELEPGDNYFKITVTSENKEVENEFTLKITVEKPVEKVTIFNKTFEVIDDEPTLTTTSKEAKENGLYKSTTTNDGSPTYYFRGNVENYVDFAGYTWRVVRINEDGTIRLIMQDGINENTKYAYNSNYDTKMYMYYTNNSNARTQLETWYNDKIASNATYSNRVASGNYFCEEARVARNSTYVTNGGASMAVSGNYTPDFTCEKTRKDGNGKGYVPGSVGLITYDEVVYAGGHYGVTNTSYYLYSIYAWYTMSPAGFSDTNSSHVWYVTGGGLLDNYNYVGYGSTLRPVINLKADTNVTGEGTSDSHWVVAN